MLHLAEAMPLLKEFPKKVPNFRTIYTPTNVRRFFEKQKSRRSKTGRNFVWAAIRKMILKRAAQTRCCKASCLKKAVGNDEYMQEVGKWRQAWHQTPRRDRIHALMEHIKQLPGAAVPAVHELGLALGGRDRKLALTCRGECRRQYHFLRRTVCSRAFSTLTGVNPHHATSRLSVVDFHTCTHTQNLSQGRIGARVQNLTVE